MISYVKKARVLLLCCALGPACLLAQEQPYNAIKLYVSRTDQPDSVLPDNLRERLFSKITQLINQTGIAEEGFSNFYVVPKVDTVGTYIDNAGTTRIYTTECELTLQIRNTSYTTHQHVVLGSMARKLTGSAMRRQDALYNAISSISPNDPELVKFFQQAKAKISTYFQQHCSEVIADALQAEKLNNFSRAISLYFSVPSDAPAACYQQALSGIKRTYSQYVSQKCNMQLLRLKAFVARAQTTDSLISLSNYNEIMKLIGQLDPSSDECYGEAKKLIEKIEGRFDLQQKQAWEMKKKSIDKDETQVKQQVRNAVAHISSEYQATAQTPADTHH